MEHGVSWFSFLPGFRQLEAYFAHTHTGALGGTPMLQHVAAALLVALVVLIMSSRVRADLDQAPDGGLIPDANLTIRNVFEVIFEALYGQMKSIIGPECKTYFPVIGTLTLFILFSNLLGMIPGFTPPTDNWNTTFACSIIVFLYYNFHGLRAQGWGHIAHMANPAGTPSGWFLAPLMFPIELVSHFARPLSLGVRLATNMVADHAVLGTFLGLLPILIPLPFMLLGLMVCVIQTVVFVLLTMVYIGMSVQDSHVDHDEHNHSHTASAAV